LFTDFVERHPSLYVFAYKGVSLQTCFDAVCDFYQTHKEIPKNRYPLGIAVNGEYFIKYCRAESETTTGAKIAAGTFFPMQLEEHMRGYTFIDILNSISSYVDWLPYMRVDIRRYFNHGFRLPGA